MNEIEEKFFKTFGIKPHYIDGCKLADRYWHNEELANEYGTFDQYMKIECPAKYQDCTDECKYAFDKEIYPEITDRILLELIILLSIKTVVQIDDVQNYKYLKNNILRCCIDLMEAKEINVNAKQQLKHQVQSLFTEVE